MKSLYLIIKYNTTRNNLECIFLNELDLFEVQIKRLIFHFLIFKNRLLRPLLL